MHSGKGLLLVSVLLMALTYFLWLPSSAVFWSPDGGGKYLDLVQMTASARFTASLPYPGEKLDPKFQYVPLLYYSQGDGQLHSWWPAWFPALSVPLYQSFGPRGIFVIPLVSGLLIAWLTYLALQDLSEVVAVSAAGLIFCASPVGFYSFTFWEHTLHTLLVVAAILIYIRYWSRGSSLGPVISGVLLGLAFYLRLETVLWVAAVGGVELLWQLKEHKFPHFRQIVVYTVVFLLVAFPVLLINLNTTGHWLGGQYSEEFISHFLGEFPAALHKGWVEVLPNLLLGTARHQGADLTIPLRWSFVLAVLVVAGGAWLVSRNLGGLAVAALLWLTALCSRLLFAPESYAAVHGFVLSAPWVVLSGWAMRPQADTTTRRWGHLVLFSGLAFTLATYQVGWEGQGGLQWGPRYALPLYPLFGIAVVRGVFMAVKDSTFPQLFRFWLIGALIILTVLGVGFEIRGLSRLYASKNRYVDWQAELLALPEDAVIVTELPYLALTLPEVYQQRVLHFAKPEDLLTSCWQGKAWNAGYRQIYYVTSSSLERIQLAP